MSKPLLRLIEPALCGSEVLPTEPSAPSQLSLFDMRPCHRMICLPMADIHGATFARAVSQSACRLVLDARTYPYFDLPGLSRSVVFRLFEDLSCRYVHSPIDLRSPQDQSARWQRRQAVRDVLIGVVGGTAYVGGSSVIVLVNRTPEIEVLDGSLRGLVGEEDHVWLVQPHEAIGRVGGSLSA